MKKILKYFLTASLFFNTVLTQLNSLTTQQDQLSSKTIEIGTALATSLDPQLGVKIKEDKLHALECVSHITAIAEGRLKLKFDPQIYNSLQNLYASIYGSLSLAVESISSQQDKLITFIETLYNYETKKQDQYPFRYPIVFALLTISKILATQEEGYQGPTYSQKQLSAFNNAIKNKFESVYNQEQQNLIKTTITKGKIKTLCSTLEQILPLAPALWNPLHWKPSTILTIAGIGCVISLTAAIIVLTINTNHNVNRLVQTLMVTTQTTRQEVALTIQAARDVIGTRQPNGQFPEGSLRNAINCISNAIGVPHVPPPPAHVRRMDHQQYPITTVRGFIEHLNKTFPVLRHSLNQVAARVGRPYWTPQVQVEEDIGDVYNNDEPPPPPPYDENGNNQDPQEGNGNGNGQGLWGEICERIGGLFGNGNGNNRNHVPHDKGNDEHESSDEEYVPHDSSDEEVSSDVGENENNESPTTVFPGGLRSYTPSSSPEDMNNSYYSDQQNHPGEVGEEEIE